VIVQEPFLEYIPIGIINLVKTHSTIITGLEQINDEVCIQLTAQPFLQPIAGQFFQAFAAESTDLLPTLLHPCRVASAELVLCGDIPKDWAPGTELHIRGPRGNGFHLPPLTRKVALSTLDGLSINYVMALANAALSTGVEVTLFTNQRLSELAPEIEVLPLEELSQAKDWADYLAAVLLPDQVPPFRETLKINPGKRMPFTVEVMLKTPMICDELSTCGACAVFTSRGWRLACKDGPVFALDDLLPEDGSLG